MPVTSTTHPALKNMDLLAKLMDSQFRIPGTGVRFGLDAIVGLIPGGGDFASFLVSTYMLSVLAKNGASGFVLSRMVFNIVLDGAAGSVPILGDIFDVAFKANQRNMQLMREHYVDGRHKGGAWKLLVPLLIVLFLFIGLMAWLGYKLFRWMFG